MYRFILSIILKQIIYYYVGNNPNAAQTGVDVYRNSLYKTQLCRHFMSKGMCAQGAACQYAHGEKELRTR